MPLTLSFNSIFEPGRHCGVVGAKKDNPKVLTLKKAMLAGACAVLTVLSAPVAAAATPEVPAAAPWNGSVEQGVDAFYASRGGAPLWLRGGANSSAANELIGILQRAPLDGLASGPALALPAQSLAGRASVGVAAAPGPAERLPATAWV